MTIGQCITAYLSWIAGTGYYEGYVIENGVLTNKTKKYEKGMQLIAREQAKQAVKKYKTKNIEQNG